MPRVTTVLVRCYECGRTWQQPLRHPIIGAVNGDTIRLEPGSISLECPRCRAQVANYITSEVHVTGKTIQGFFALLQSASPADLEKLARIAAAARKNGSSTDEITEEIKRSIPSLRPLLAWMYSQEGVATATWISTLLTLLAFIFAIEAPAPVERPVIIIEHSSGEERQIDNLILQVANLRSALNAFEAAAATNKDKGH